MTWFKNNWFILLITALILGILTIFFGDKVKETLSNLFKNKTTTPPDTNTASTTQISMPTPAATASAAGPIPGDLIYAKGEANVRRGPSTNAEVAYKAANGRLIGRLSDTVAAQGGTATGTWYKVIPDAANIIYMLSPDEVHYIYSGVATSGKYIPQTAPNSLLHPFG